MLMDLLVQGQELKLVNKLLGLEQHQLWIEVQPSVARLFLWMSYCLIKSQLKPLEAKEGSHLELPTLQHLS